MKPQGRGGHARLRTPPHGAPDPPNIVGGRIGVRDHGAARGGGTHPGTRGWGRVSGGTGGMAVAGRVTVVCSFPRHLL